MGLADALEATERFLRRFVVFADDHQPVAVTLWIAGTHCFERFRIFPYLGITSPTKRAGKTQLLDTTALLVARPWGPLIQPSPAVTFRMIDRDRPTMLLDEVDTVFRRGRDFEELRAILNGGYRVGVKVARVGGEKQRTLQHFDVFCPKALAGIGRLPDTVADRSIPIRLKRRAKNETVEPFRSRVVEAEAAPIRNALAAAVGNVPAEGPWLDQLNDRAADSWEPLLAIAESAGDDWLDRGTAAAVALSREVDPDDQTLGERLLTDCKAVFADHDQMFTDNLVTLLCGVDDAPWIDLNGKQLTGHKLARLLKPFGVRPSGTIRDGAVTAKGYLRSSFEDAWSRHAPDDDEGEAERDGVTLPPPSAEGNGQARCHHCGKQAKHTTPGGKLWCDPCLISPFPTTRPSRR